MHSSTNAKVIPTARHGVVAQSTYKRAEASDASLVGDEYAERYAPLAASWYEIRLLDLVIGSVWLIVRSVVPPTASRTLQ